jgi:hypothetical protein
MGIIGKLFGKSNPLHPQFQEMRSRLLAIRPSEIGLADDRGAPIFGIVMETGVDGDVATFACLADGTVSVYLSSGTLIIGAGQHESVRSAADELLKITNEYAVEYIAAASADMQPELPRNGRVHFYLLTHVGMYNAACSEEDLEAQADPFTNLYTNCHMVMAEVRAIEEQHRR